MNSAKSNPITNHHIGATGCDGSIAGFLTSRHTVFKYHACRHPANFTAVYKNLAALAIGSTEPANASLLKELKNHIEQLEVLNAKASEGIAEAERCMETMLNATIKITAQVDEALGIKPQISED